MTDVTYFECSREKFSEPTGPPTNMSVRGCDFSGFYDFNPISVFKVQNKPSADKVYNTLLNPNVVSDDRYDKTFNAINVKYCPRSSCIGTTYLNSDPRLYNSASATWMQLDKPPRNSTMKLDTLTTDKSLNNYGQSYKSYADVNGGDILYYIGDREDAFDKQLFSNNSTTVGTLHKDPMGAMIPRYERIPHDKFNPVIGDSYNVDGDACLSFLKDTQEHREDLVSRQMSTINKQRYAPRWT